MTAAGETATPRRALLYPLWLIVASALGLLAAFELTLEKLLKAGDAGANAACDFSVVVQCSANLASWQGSVFGFPNPLIGLMAWPFVLVIAVLVLGRVELPRWIFRVFTLGTLAGTVFVGWLIYQSIFVLGTLCPWCMATWFAMIPTFVSTVIYGGSRGLLFSGERAQAAIMGSKKWVPLFYILLVFGLALTAQLRLDVLATL